MENSVLSRPANSGVERAGLAWPPPALPPRRERQGRPAVFAGSLSVAQLTPLDAAEWDAYVDRHPGATCYHLLAWQTAAAAAYGTRTPSLVVRRVPGGRLCGVLPLFVVDTPLRSYATSGIFGGYGAVLADDAACGRALVEEAWELSGRLGLSCLVHKGLGLEDPALEPGAFQCLDRWVTATLSLAGGSELVWSRLRSEIRNRIRKAQKSGLVARWGADQLDAYYEVLAENMHRKGTPIYGQRFMAELVRGLGARAEVVTLAQDGDVLAGALVVYHNGVVNVPFVSARHRAFSLCPNNLLYWEVIQRAVEGRQHTLDFGRSLRGSTNLDFKVRWGATLTPQPFHVRRRRGGPTFDQTAGSVERLVRLWQALPRRVVDALGPKLCGRFLV